MTANPQIDFYILEEAGGLKSLHFMCGLVEKAYREQQHVYIHTHSLEEAERIDMLLWTYRDDSFLPHQIDDHSDDLAPPVQIGCVTAPLHQRDVLVNLNREMPVFFKQFKRIIEIVFSDASVQQLARERYRQYRDQACEIKTYKIKANET